MKVPVSPRVSAAALAILLAVFVTGQSAEGTEPGIGRESGGWAEDVPDGMWYDPAAGELRDDALERDATIVAKKYGKDAGLILASLRAQQIMDEVVAELTVRYPDTFAGLYWADGPHAVVQFKGTVPDDAAQLLEASGVDIRYVIVEYAASDLASLQRELVAFLESQGIDDFVVAVDPESQRVVATARRGARPEPLSVESLYAVLPRTLADADVAIDVIDGPAFTELTTYGGANLRKDGALWCTSGFTVRSGSIDGVATAGHCGSLMTPYHDPFTGAVHTMTYKNGFVGNWGDFEWFTTTGTEIDDFYHTNAGARRDVSGVKASFSVGDTLFWYGRSTLDEYTSTVKYPAISAGGTGNLVCTKESGGGPGDSGGPVYIGNTAAGFITALAVIDGAIRSCHSQARYIDDAIAGLSIKQ